MLKLKKTSHDRQLTVIVNNKEGFFTPPLLIAFSIAFVIHLLLLVVFQITPIALKLNERMYPPAIVHVDPLINSGATVIAAVPTTVHTKDHLPSPPSLKPILPEIPAFATIRHEEGIQQSRESSNPFSHLEKDIYEISIAALKPPQHFPDLTVIMSGPIASVPWTRVNDSRHINFIKELQPYRVIYSVIADRASGHIVWYTLKESSSSSLLDKQAETILSTLQFEKNTSEFTVEGEIELHFYKNKARTEREEI